jgi:hypothetical protein
MIMGLAHLKALFNIEEKRGMKKEEKSLEIGLEDGDDAKDTQGPEGEDLRVNLALEIYSSNLV